MQSLYNLAGRLQTAQVSNEAADPPVLSVYYGAELRFAYSKYPLWFRRIDGIEQKQQTTGPEKHMLENGEDHPKRGGNEKKKKIRSGKQSDIGSILGEFS